MAALFVLLPLLLLLGSFLAGHYHGLRDERRLRQHHCNQAFRQGRQSEREELLHEAAVEPMRLVELTDHPQPQYRDIRVLSLTGQVEQDPLTGQRHQRLT